MKAKLFWDILLGLWLSLFASLILSIWFAPLTVYTALGLFIGSSVFVCIGAYNGWHYE